MIKVKKEMKMSKKLGVEVTDITFSVAKCGLGLGTPRKAQIISDDRPSKNP